jgi:hypothetical protein
MFSAQEKKQQGAAASVRTRTLPPQAPVPTPGRIRRDLALPSPRYLAASHSACTARANRPSHLSSSSLSLSPTVSNAAFTLNRPSGIGSTVSVAVVKSDSGYKIENNKSNNRTTTGSSSSKTEGIDPHNPRKFKQKGKQVWVWLLLMGLTLALTPASSHDHHNDKNNRRHRMSPPATVVTTPSSRLSQKLVHLPRHELDQLIVQHIWTKLYRSPLPLGSF